MARGKKKDAALLQELISKARELNIEVRAERLMREVGYHAHSGRCRLRGKEMLILDRDAPIRDQVEFLTGELEEKKRIKKEPTGPGFSSPPPTRS